MQDLTAAELCAVRGGGFWKGFACGGTAMFALGALFSPEPASKLVLGRLAFAAMAACGAAFA